MIHRIRRLVAAAAPLFAAAALLTAPPADAATIHSPFYDRMIQGDLAVMATRIDQYVTDHGGAPPPVWWIAAYWQGTGAFEIDYWHNETAYCLDGRNFYGTLTDDLYWRGTDLPQTIATFDEIQAGSSPCADVLADPINDNKDPNPPTIDGGVPGAATGAQVTGFVVDDVKHLVHVVRRYQRAHGAYPSSDWTRRRTRITTVFGGPVYVQDPKSGGYCIETHNSKTLLGPHQFMWFGNGMSRILVATIAQAERMHNACGRMLRDT